MSVRSFLYAHPALRRMAVRLRDRLQKRQYRRRTAGVIPTEPKRYLFCAYAGKSFACSPKALYEVLREDPDPDLVFVWAFQEPEKHSALAAQERRIRLVEYGSEAFRKELARCRYWVFNTRVPSYAVKKPDQYYIQTWHGTPLKRLGYDVEQYITGADDKESLRYSYRTDAARYDVLLSPSPFYTEKMTSAFHLKALGKADAVLEKGYPRNDALYAASAEKIAALRAQFGIGPGEKVILYAPTWRENALDPGKGSTYGEGIAFDLKLDPEKLLDAAGAGSRLLLRMHYFSRQTSQPDNPAGRIVDVSEYDDINDLYLISDLLITDYSSVFFDYAVLDRPILFYMYDLDSYQNVRDFYLPLSSLPGSVVRAEDALYAAAAAALQAPSAVSTAFHKKFHPYPGEVSRTVWEEIRRREDSARRI